MVNSCKTSKDSQGANTVHGIILGSDFRSAWFGRQCDKQHVNRRGQFQAEPEWEEQLLFHEPDAFLIYQCLFRLKPGSFSSDGPPVKGCGLSSICCGSGASVCSLESGLAFACASTLRPPLHALQFSCGIHEEPPVSTWQTFRWPRRIHFRVSFGRCSGNALFHEKWFPEDWVFIYQKRAKLCRVWPFGGNCA